MFIHLYSILIQITFVWNLYRSNSNHLHDKLKTLYITCLKNSIIKNTEKNMTVVVDTHTWHSRDKFMSCLPHTCLRSFHFRSQPVHSTIIYYYWLVQAVSNTSHTSHFFLPSNCRVPLFFPNFRTALGVYGNSLVGWIQNVDDYHHILLCVFLCRKIASY